MARRDRRETSTPKEQLDAYKKEIGKQYMDGLISDKEYEKLLHDREAELKLNSQPAAANGPETECPSCGALVEGHETECGICGSALVPVLVKNGKDSQPEILPVNGAKKAPENWREKWLDKAYREMPVDELLNQPPHVLKGVSEGDSKKLKDAFNIKTLEDFATVKYLAWAQELVALKGSGGYRKSDFRFRLIKEYEKKDLDEVLKAPTYALQGVSESDSNRLTKAFNTRTVEELGNLKFITWANRIYEMAHGPHIFKVGDRVRLPSGKKGTVISATEPDARGNQKVDVAVG